MYVTAADIAVHQGQSRHAEYHEVEVMPHLPGFFLGVVVAGVVAVVGQGAATGAVDAHPHAVAGEFLQAHIEGVAAVFGREQGEHGLVVEVAGQGAAVFLAVEETEVGPQGPVAHGLAVGQVEVLLLVDIGQLGVPHADLGALVVEGVFAAAEVEAIGGERGFAVHEHVFHARVVARAVAAKLAAVEGQAGDFAGRHLAAAKGLGQRAAIVGAQDRQHRHPLADLQFGLRQPGFQRHAQAPEVVGGAAVIVDRQQLGTAGAFAAIELLGIQPQHIDAEPHGALGEAGLGVENKTLRPLFGLALGVARVGEVAVEVGVAQVERGLGIIDETVGMGEEGQGKQADNTETRGRIAGEWTHSDAPFHLLFLLFVIRRRTTLGRIFAGFSWGVKQKLYDD
ncbi:hypothetical protein EMIT0357P_60090 [Pseudomonas marginalis]